MKTLMTFVCALLLCAGAAVAMERSVALPYQYNTGGSGGSMVFVPKCTANQYVGVSGSVFVCRDVVSLLPSCAAGQYVTVSGTSAVCVTPTAAADRPGTMCGHEYRDVGWGGWWLTARCFGMRPATEGCPTGYTKMLFFGAYGNQGWTCVKN